MLAAFTSYFSCPSRLPVILCEKEVVFCIYSFDNYLKCLLDWMLGAHSVGDKKLDWSSVLVPQGKTSWKIK